MHVLPSVPTVAYSFFSFSISSISIQSYVQSTVLSFNSISTWVRTTSSISLLLRYPSHATFVSLLVCRCLCVAAGIVGLVEVKCGVVGLVINQVMLRDPSSTIRVGHCLSPSMASVIVPRFISGVC